MFLNIESYGGGVKLWSVDGGEEKEAEEAALASGGQGAGASSSTTFHSASMQDGLLEVVAVNGVVHLGQLQVRVVSPYGAFLAVVSVVHY